MSLTGREGEPPTFCGPAINDKATGMWVVIGALSALERRRRTGKGGVVDTSLFESSVSWVDNHLAAFIESGNAPVRHGTGSANLVPYQVFDTADRPICIAAGNDRLFAKLATALGRPEWSTDERFAKGIGRRENRAVLVPLLQAELARQPREHWVTVLDAAGVPVSEVNDIPELAASPQLEAVDIMARLPDGTSVVMTPITVDGERPRVRTDSPKLGAHDGELFGD